MKKLGRALKIFITIFIVIIFLGIISIPIVNNLTAIKIADDLKSLPLPEHTELVDSASKAAKITGNGNGMQYWGAILIKSELSIDELNEFYSSYRGNEWECNVVNQNAPGLDFIERNDELRFSQYDENLGPYYIVFSWGNGISSFNKLDLRGH